MGKLGPNGVFPTRPGTAVHACSAVHPLLVRSLARLLPPCMASCAHKQARDFCTLVHFRTLSDGTLAQVSRPVEHPAAPRSSRYVRSEILLA